MRSEAVLVVDDHLPFLRVVARAARRAEVRHVAASTCAEALEAVRTLGPRLRAALLDYHLPDGDCLGLVSAIRTVAPRAELAVVSGHLDADSALALRFSHNLPWWWKPLRDEQLLLWLEGVKRRSVGRIVDHAAAEYALTASAVETLEHAMLHGCEHDVLARALDLPRESVKSRVKRLLASTGDPSLRELVERLGPAVAAAATVRR